MAKRLFHSCRSPSVAAAVTPSTTLLARNQQQHAVPAPAGAACCRRGVPRQRERSGHPAACGEESNAAVDNYGGDDLHPARATPAYRWLKSSRWHVIEANAYATTAAVDGSDDAPRLKIDLRRRVRRPRRRRVGALHRKGAAPPASLSSEDSAWFSTDDDDEERPHACGCAESSTLVTSTTPTTESSSTGAGGSSGSVVGTSAREQGKDQRVAVAGGFAVVKRSEDPRADFRRSMAEMVVGRGIYDADGLEHLLRCFLTLNGPRHRRDIVAAFGDVWEAVFGNPSCDDDGQPSGAVTSSHASSSGKAATVCLSSPVV